MVRIEEALEGHVGRTVRGGTAYLDAVGHIDVGGAVHGGTAYLDAIGDGSFLASSSDRASGRDPGLAASRSRAMAIVTGPGDELPEEMVNGEHLGGLAHHDKGKGPSAFDHNAGTAAAGPSSTTRPYLEALLKFHASLDGKLVTTDKGQGPSASSGTHIDHDDEDSDHALYVKFGVDEDVPVIVQHEVQHAPVIVQHEVQHEVAPVIIQQQQVPVIDEDDGFTVVRSRKFGMIRGRYPEGPYIAPEEQVLENEVLWIPKAGRLRKTKQWAQARQGRYIGSPDGSLYIVYGTYGLNNSLEY